jgi:osmotically-inducible protein OsmY
MSSPNRLLMACCAVVLSALVSGCAGIVIGAGASIATAAMEERGVTVAANDLAIRAKINSLWLKHSEEIALQTNIIVWEGRVLLTGTLPTSQMRLDAVRLAWQVGGVRDVINEIGIATPGGVSSYARDGWITTQMVTNLTLDRNVLSINYGMETVGGTIYLIGIAQDEAELTRVRNHARSIAYVKRVVSHVRVKKALQK